MLNRLRRFLIRFDPTLKPPQIISMTYMMINAPMITCTYGDTLPH